MSPDACAPSAALFKALAHPARLRILEVLAEGPLSLEGLCASLAADTGQSPDELSPIIDACWPRLIDAGLVRRLVDAPAAVPASAS